MSWFENLDILILDDMQFSEGKDRIQEEVYRVLSKLIMKGTQVVLEAMEFLIQNAGDFVCKLLFHSFILIDIFLAQCLPVIQF